MIRPRLDRAAAAAALCLAAACLLAAAAGCSPSEEDFTFVVRDDEGQAVEGIEIRLAGAETRLGVTDARGSATVRVPKPSGQSLRFRLSQAEGAPETYTMAEVYEVGPSTFETGILTVRLEPAGGPSTASLEVSSAPAGAEVWVDGQNRGTTPTQLDGLEPGRHEVEIRLRGHHPYAVEAYLLAGENGLDAPLQAVGQAGASLRVGSSPQGAEIVVDGRPTGHKTPTLLSDLQPGRHTIRLVLPGREPFETTVEVRAGGPVGSVFGSLGDGGALASGSDRSTGADRADTRAGDRGDRTSSGGPVGGSGERASGTGGAGETGGTGAASRSGSEQRGGGSERSGSAAGEAAGGTARSDGGGADLPQFKKEYQVTVVPGAAEVYLDGAGQDLFYNGPFKITLRQGIHRFRVKNAAVPVDMELRYEVEPGDRNRVLVLDWQSGKVTARK